MLNTEHPLQYLCPLCGTKFEAKTTEGLTAMMLRHVNIGYCHTHGKFTPEDIHGNSVKPRSRIWRG